MSHGPREEKGRGRVRSAADPAVDLGVKDRIVRGLRIIAEEPDDEERQRALARDRIRGALGKVLVDGQLPPEEEQ